MYTEREAENGPMPYEFVKHWEMLGVTSRDTAWTMEMAYDLQIACDSLSLPKYLGALQALSTAPIAGNESMQMKVATERSLDRYTIGGFHRCFQSFNLDLGL